MNSKCKAKKANAIDFNSDAIACSQFVKFHEFTLLEKRILLQTSPNYLQYSYFAFFKRGNFLEKGVLNSYRYKSVSLQFTFKSIFSF